MKGTGALGREISDLDTQLTKFATQPGGELCAKMACQRGPTLGRNTSHPLARAAQEEGVAHLEGARAGGCQLTVLLTTEQQALPGREA